MPSGLRDEVGIRLPEQIVLQAMWLKHNGHLQRRTLMMG
jgi:hypothetical protein